MIKRFYRYLVLITLVILSLTTSAWAVPNLQIYIPGAEYVVGTDDEGNTTETWVINSYNYELWVIGANLPIYDVKLALAVSTNENGTIVIDSETLDETYDHFFDNGIPTMGDGITKLPSHGVFPTSYYEYFIGDFCIGMNKDNKELYEKVYNYVPDPDEVPSLWDEYGNPAYGWGYGEVKKFKISVESVEGYNWVDIVAYDHIYKSNEKTRCCFTPFSHDGGWSPIPEPATMFLVGTGLISLGWVARRKCKK